MYEYDASLAYISLEEAQRFFSMGRTRNGHRSESGRLFTADAVAKRIDAQLGTGYMARDWMLLNRTCFRPYALKKP